MYVELIEKNKGNRGHMVEITAVDPHKKRPFEAYASICPFSEGIISHMASTKSSTHPRGTVSGYNGIVYCRWVYWDFDGGPEELLSTYMDAKRLVNGLVNIYQVPKNDIVIYYSGSKGFHVGISADHFGSIEPNEAHKMADNLNELTQTIIDEICESQNIRINSYDSGLYAINRYFRLPNSLHAKTNRYKIPFSVDEFWSIKVNDIIEKAKDARLDFSFNLSKKILPKKGLQKLWTIIQAGKVTTEQERLVLDSVPKDEKEQFELAVKLTQEKISSEDYFNKQKNNYTFMLAAWCNDFGIGSQGDGQRALELILNHREHDLKDDPKKWDMKRLSQTVLNVYSRLQRKFGQKQDFVKVSIDPNRMNWKAELQLIDDVVMLSKSSNFRPKQLMRLALALNASSKNVLPENKVYDIVMKHSVKGKIYGEKDMPKPIYEYAGDFVTKAQRTANSKGIGIYKIDQAENFDYEGKVCQVIGMGGVGKSIFLKDILDHLSLSKERCWYSTMEDTAIRLFMRVMQATFEPHIIVDPETEDIIEQISALSRLREMSRANSDKTRKFIYESMKAKYEDYFLIDERVGMSKYDYEESIKYLLNKHGNLGAVGIDGLSTMSSRGMGEIEASIRNSFDVKEIANEYKLFVPILIHTSGNTDREYRTLWDKTRGGPKVMQNADFFIALSSIRDEASSEPGSPVYYNDRIWLKYWGKRTSGQYEDIILKLNSEDLKWEVDETPIDEVNLDLF